MGGGGSVGRLLITGQRAQLGPTFRSSRAGICTEGRHADLKEHSRKVVFLSFWQSSHPLWLGF